MKYVTAILMLYGPICAAESYVTEMLKITAKSGDVPAALGSYGYCEMSKKRVDLNNLPGGAIIVRRDGGLVPAMEIVMDGNHVEHFQKRQGWKMAEIRSVFSPCLKK